MPRHPDRNKSARYRFGRCHLQVLDKGHSLMRADRRVPDDCNRDNYSRIFATALPAEAGKRPVGKMSLPCGAPSTNMDSFCDACFVHGYFAFKPPCGFDQRYSMSHRWNFTIAIKIAIGDGEKHRILQP